MLVAMLMLLQSAYAAQLLVLAPEQIVPGRAESLSLELYANSSFDGLIMVNATNCNISQTVFGFSRLEFTTSALGYVYRRSLALQGLRQGNYSLYFKVFNLSNSLFAVSSATGIVDYFDKEAPIILSKLPNGMVHSALVNISIATNEPATCRIDLNNVSSMAIELSGQDRYHSRMMEFSSGLYRYYVSCSDAAGNAIVPVALDFEVSQPPTAKITLSDASPVKAGLLEISLESSEPLRPTPSLTYDFDGSSQKQISLEGSAKKWTGYVLIDDANDQKIGTFHFSGVSLQGDTGTIISSGEIFIADTRKPPAPQSLKATSSARIELQWYYDGESVDHYNIYRSVSPSVSYANYYAKSSSKSFADSDTLGGMVYYYRVSAVDLADNEGPLSDEVSAVSMKQLPQTQTQQSSTLPEKNVVLRPDLVLKVNNSMNYIGKLYLDADWAKSALADVSDSDMGQLVSDLGLLEKVSSMKAKLDQYRSQLRDMWYTDIAETELDKRLNNIIDKIDLLRKTIPGSVRIVERSVIVQAYSEPMFLDAVSQVLADYHLNSSLRSEYQSASLRLQNDVQVMSDARIVELKYLDGSTQNLTMMTKDVSCRGTSTLRNVKLVESIPKEFARHLGEITFITTGYAVLQEDPVVLWNIDSLGSRRQIKYYVSKRIPLEDAKKASTFVLLEPGSLPQHKNETSVPTGQVINEETGHIFTPTETIMIMIGLVFILGLVAYYFVFSGASLDDMMAERYMRSYMRRARHLEEKASEIGRLRTEYMPMKNENDFIYAQVLLQRASELLEAGKFEHARAIYHEMTEIYSRLGPGQRLELYDRCVNVFAQIDSLQKKR
jgi:hypothetical protein